MTTRSVAYTIEIDAAGNPQPLTLEPPIPGFTVIKAVVIANGSGSVAQLNGVADQGVDTPALLPLTQDIFPFTNVRGQIHVTWLTSGPVPITPYMVATFSDDPAVDFAGKVYPASLSPLITVAVSDMYNPVPVETTGGGGAGSLLNWASYGASVAHFTAGDPVAWTPEKTNNFDYLNGAGTGLIFPPDTISLVALSGTASYNSTDASFLSINLEGVAGAYGASVFQVSSATPQAYEANMAFDSLYDSSLGDTPLQYILEDASSTDPTEIALLLSIMSFATP